MNNPVKTNVLFVCLGNICRSPTAHGVFQAMVDEQGLTELIAVDSCGTGDWHVGNTPDRRSTAKAAKRGYDISSLRARQFQASDFGRFDYILAMDKKNLAAIEEMRPDTFSGHLELFLGYAGNVELEEVPDPYYGGAGGFNYVLDLVEWASEGLLREIVSARSAG